MALEVVVTEKKIVFFSLHGYKLTLLRNEIQITLLRLCLNNLKIIKIIFLRFLLFVKNFHSDHLGQKKKILRK